MKKIKIKKRDGSYEEWSYDKILAAIGKSMVPLKKAEAVATSVEKWVEKNSGKGEINSTEVRDKVVEVLKEIDPVAAENFMVFKKG